MKDYSRLHAKPAPQKNEGITPPPLRLRWLFIGLGVLLGVIAAKDPFGFKDRAKAVELAEDAPPISEVVKEEVAVSPPKVVKPETKFSFYEVLPNQTVEVQEEVAQAQPEVAVDPTEYMVQVASYQESEKADTMKRRLQALGYTPNITQTDNNWYRVDIGPVESTREANAIRHVIQQADILGSIVRQI